MKKKAGKRLCVNRVLAMVLAVVLSLGLCACGETTDGGQEDDKKEVAGATGDEDAQGTPGEQIGGEDAVDDRILWVEIINDNKVNICLRDERVNQLQMKDNGDGSATILNSIDIRFMKNGEDALECTLHLNAMDITVPKSDFYEFQEADSTFPDNKAVWTIKYRGIAEILRNCEELLASFEENSETFTVTNIMTIRDAEEMAKIFYNVEDAGETQGVQLGFDGDMVYVNFYGREMLDLARANEADSQAIALGFGADPQHYPDCSLAFLPTNLGGAGIEGSSAGAKLLWGEAQEDQVSLWFQAPGFEALVRSMPEYSLNIYDGPEFVGEKGIPDDIIGEYVPYFIPELPAEFRLAEQDADADYFTPLTPNYIVTRYDYPAVPVTQDFQWYLINRLGPSYGFMSIDVDLVSATKLVLISYGISGGIVARQAKCVYGSEEDAIHANVVRHDVLQDAIGETYGTEVDYQQWIYDAFLERGSNSQWMVLHQGNVNYYGHSQVAISEADALFDTYMEPESTGTGSYTYQYNYGHASSESGESTCTYQSWASFDMDAVKGR